MYEHHYSDSTVKYVCTCAAGVIVAVIAGICVVLHKLFRFL